MITREDVRNKVFQSVSETFNFPLEEINDEMNAGDIGGWDSISTSYLILDIEEKFDTEFPVDELISTENLGSMIDFIHKIVA